MKILITGGAGFIGSHSAKEFEKGGHKVCVIDDLSSGNMTNLGGFRGKIYKGDIVSYDLKRFCDFDCIFHQAAITDTTFGDKRRMRQVNIQAFKKLVNFCLQFKIKLIYASSASIYGRGSVPMREEQLPQPLNFYAKTKLEMDKLTQNLIGKCQKPTIIGLRYFNVYGTNETFKKKAASQVWQLLQQMKPGKKPRLFKWGEQRRDFIYVKDVVNANKKALSCQASGIFNIGTGQAWTFNQIVSILNKLLGTSYRIDYFDNPYTEVYQDNTQADITNAQKILNFQAKYSLEEGIADLIKIETYESN